MKRIWLVATVLLMTACGSKVPLSEENAQAAQNGSGVGLVAPQPTLPGATQAPADTGPGLSASGPTGRHAPTGNVVSTLPGEAGSTASSTPAGNVRKTSAHSPVEIGFITTTVGNAQSLGVNAGQSYSDQAMYSALVAEINKNGGLAGHPIKPVYASTDTASSNWASEFQSACAKFTQDNHVQAVIGYIFVFLPSFESCLAKANVAHLYGGYQPGDLVDQQQFPTLVSTDNPTVDGASLTALDGAMRAGLLTKSTKLGLLLDTCADGDRAYSHSVEPWLKAHGLNFETVLGSCSQGSTDLSGAVTAVSNAELRFASSGVKVVMGGGVPLLLFMEDAQSQGYQPKYVTIVGGAALEANAPASQMKNLHGFGWLPAVDVDPVHQPYPKTAPQKACLAMLAKHALVAKQYNDFLGAYAACDGLNLYAKALAAGATTPQQAVTDVMAAENHFVGALTYDGQMFAGPRQHGGPRVFRQYAWVSSCSCLQYQGPTYPMASP